MPRLLVLDDDEAAPRAAPRGVAAFAGAPRTRRVVGTRQRLRRLVTLLPHAGTGRQLALYAYSRADVAHAAGVCVRTVRRAEGRGELRLDDLPSVARWIVGRGGE